MSTMAFAATIKRRELVDVVSKRTDIPIIFEGELSTSAGESTGKAAAWACSCRRCCRWRRSHGRRSDWGTLVQLRTAHSGAGKRKLDLDSEVSDTGLLEAKIPKIGAGPDSEDAPDDVFSNDDLAANTVYPTKVLNIRSKKYIINNDLTDNIILYRVIDPNSNKVIDDIRINIVDKSITLDDSNNNLDEIVSRVRA